MKTSARVQSSAKPGALVASQPPARKDELAGAATKAPAANKAGGFFDGLIDFFTSLRLTVVLLGLGLLLVFFGTLAQVDLGLYKAQNEFFRSYLICWGPKGVSWKIPVFPGGYTIGGLLLINLLAAHFRRFTWTRKKIGIWMVHIGVILLLLGQLLTDMLSHESVLHLREGEAKNYSETEREAELAVIDTTDPDTDTVVAIPQQLLTGEIQRPELPFKLRIRDFYANSQVRKRAADALVAPAATQGIGAAAVAKELPHVTSMEERDVPSAVVEVVTAQGPLGTWLVSEFIEAPQPFAWNNRTYELVLRPRRHYKPFSMQLLKFQHDIYAGTDIPKNFSSRVLLQRPETGEKREVLIYMNNPLRYAGETFYQASFDRDDQGTVLQVVHNPSWLTPYFSCVLVAAGLLVQFLTHLLGFVRKRRTA
jgi:hypothetical protein